MASVEKLSNLAAFDVAQLVLRGKGRYFRLDTSEDARSFRVLRGSGLVELAT